MGKRIWLAALLAIFTLAGCVRPEINRAGLGEDCRDAGCSDGQACIAYSHPECSGETCRSCESPCESDWDCPLDMHCQLPPLVPDQIPNICAGSSSG